MYNVFRSMKQLITFDFKKLLFFEIFMRLIGLLIILPTFRLGLFLSIKLSGYSYITNDVLVKFLLKPSSILIIIILLIIFSLYVTLEYVYLSLLFNRASNKTRISYRDFIVIGLKQTFQIIKKFHIIVLLPILMFFILIEFVQLAFFSSALKLPDDIFDQISLLRSFPFLMVIAIIFLIVFFLEFIFFIHEAVINKVSLKSSFQESRVILRDNRWKFITKFILMNIFLNLVMFLLYFLSILIFSLFIGWFRGEDVVLSLILTFAYTIYWMIGIFFSIILVPVNVAYISSSYFSVKNLYKDDIEIEVEEQTISSAKKNVWLIRLIVVTFVTVFVLNVFSISASVKAAYDRTQFFKQEEIVAHRGASFNAPENTLAAIELAILQGADGVEFDVRGTKDDVPVLLHDETLFRTTNTISNKKIWDLTFDEVREFDAGSWFSRDFAGEKIPTFEEALKVIKGRSIAFIDMKTNNINVELEVVRLIEEYDMVNEVRLMSFNVYQLFRFKEYNPNIQTILLVGAADYDIYGFVTDDRVDHFAIQINIIQNNPRMVTIIHRYGKKAYAWVVDDQRAIYIGMNADVDGFITKKPILAREIAYSKNSSDSFRSLLENLFRR